jgi:hypothetical protein
MVSACYLLYSCAQATTATGQHIEAGDRLAAFRGVWVVSTAATAFLRFELHCLPMEKTLGP